MHLDGQVALVTGGARGVGRAVAEALASAGAAVALVARSETQLVETATAIAEHGRSAIALRADATDPTAVQQVVRQTEDELGPIDLLVNNAGTCEAIGPVSDADPKAWWGDVENNFFTAFVCTRSVLPGMVARRTGRIVNVSSYAAIRPTPNISAYGAAKAAILHFTNSLAAESAEYGIAVFAITPGTVRTDLTANMTDSPAGRKWLSPIPSERWLPPEPMGELVVFLASGEADRLSGRFFHVLDDVENLVRRAEEIVRDDLYTLRLRK